jgi:hypothetical protein
MSFELDEEAASEIKRISEKRKVSPEELIGLALRFMIMTADASGQNRKVLVTTLSGYPISELVVPQR